MVGSRRLVTVSIILVCALRADPMAQANAATAPKRDVQAILDKVRDTYRNLSGYHFDRVLLVQERTSDGNAANVAELTLTIASQNAQPMGDGSPFPAVNLDRFHLRTKTKQSELLQLCDGRTCWSYTSLKNEYMTGDRFRDVNTSVGGSILLALHLFTFSTLEQGVLRDATAVREEDVEVGKERRKCYVIDGQIQATMPRPGDSTKPPALASLGAFWLVSMLTVQGLTEEGRGTRYSAWADEAAAGAGEPTRVTLWIDQTTHVIVRSTMAADLFKRTASPGQALKKVAVTVTDRFTTAAVQAPPEDLFHFTPPEGAKEVPNVASARNKK